MISFKGVLKAKEPKTIETKTTMGGLVIWDASEPNQEHPVDTSEWRRFDFVGIGKRNKGKTYRDYGYTPQDAVTSICTHHRIDPKDIKLISK